MLQEKLIRERGKQNGGGEAPRRPAHSKSSLGLLARTKDPGVTTQLRL